MDDIDILQALIDDLEESIVLSMPAVVDIAPQDVLKTVERRLKAFRLSVLVARSKAISRVRKSHQRKNRQAPVDIGEPLPEMLKKQCGFGEEDDKNKHE